MGLLYLLFSILLITQVLSDFGDELVAVEANRADSDPPSLDADVAHPDVPLPDAGLALTSSAFDAVRAKVVGLEFHRESFIAPSSLCHASSGISPAA